MAGQIIGDNTTAGFTGAAFNVTSPKQFEGGIHEVILNPSQKLVEFGILWMPTPLNGTTGTRSIAVCLYDLDTDIPLSETITTISYDTAALVAANVVTHVKASQLAIDISLHAGKRVGLGLAPPNIASNSGFQVGVRSLTGSRRNNHNTSQATLPSPFVVSTNTSDSSWGIYAITEDVVPPSVSLDSVTPDPVNNTQSITAVVSGNLAAGTVDLISGAIVVPQSVSQWAYNSGTGKTTITSAVSQGGLLFGAVTVRYTSGATVLSDVISLQPVAGNIQVPISGGLAEPGYIFEQLTGSVASITHIEHTDSPNTVISAQGAITQTIVRPFQARARDGSDNTWGAFATIVPFAIAGPAGVVAQAHVGQAAAIVGGQMVVATPSGVSCVALVGQVVPPASGLPPVAVGASIVPEFVVSGCTSVISRVEGDTYGVQVQLHSGGRPLPLGGWGQFELVVDPERNPVDATTRLMRTVGTITDAAKGKVYLPVSGDLQAGKYYFNARCVTPRGDRVTFLRGVYEVEEGIP
jgi:hypothetical protein